PAGPVGGPSSAPAARAGARGLPTGRGPLRRGLAGPAGSRSSGGRPDHIRPGTRVSRRADAPTGSSAGEVLARGSHARVRMLALTATPVRLDCWVNRRVSRAECLLERRANLAQELEALASAAATALTDALAVPVSLRARRGRPLEAGASA